MRHLLLKHVFLLRRRVGSVRGEKTEKTGAEKQMATLVLFLDEHEGSRADLTPD